MKFVDTNIFAYAIDKTDPVKQAIAKSLVAEALRPGANYGISVQVLSEFASVALRKMHIAESSVAAMLSILRRIPCLDLTPDIPIRAVDLQRLFDIQFYDAQMLAAAERLGCIEFISEDLSDGQMYGSIRSVNPFKSSEA